MFKPFLRFLERNGRKRVILDRDGVSPYLDRYYVFLKDRNKFPFNVFLHNFLRSDPDDQHDHPWSWWGTIILKGGYWEWLLTYDEKGAVIGEHKVWRGPGTIRFKPGSTYHRIELDPNVDCWTLFIPGPQAGDWGFLTHKNWKLDTFKWIRFDQYVDKRSENTMRG